MVVGKLSFLKVFMYDCFILYWLYLNVDVVYVWVMSFFSGVRNCLFFWYDECLLIYSDVLGGIFDIFGYK